MGPYKFLAPLMGEVHRARDARLCRQVAIEELAPRVANDPDALAPFDREARVIAGLSHPNILAIYDLGQRTGLDVT